LEELDIIGFISYDHRVIDADQKGLSPFDTSPSMVAEVENIKVALEERIVARMPKILRKETQPV